jgi:hypothetical protein
MPTVMLAVRLGSRIMRIGEAEADVDGGFQPVAA